MRDATPLPSSTAGTRGSQIADVGQKRVCFISPWCSVFSLQSAVHQRHHSCKRLQPASTSAWPPLPVSMCRIRHRCWFRPGVCPTMPAATHTLTVLCAGGEDGHVRVFDLRDGKPVASHRAADDTVNGFEFHPYLPFAASTSGAPVELQSFHCSTTPFHAMLSFMHGMLLVSASTLVAMFNTLASARGFYTGHRRFPAADQLSDEENEDPDSAAATAADAATTTAADAADVTKTSTSATARLENAMLIWRYQSEPCAEAVVTDEAGDVDMAADAAEKAD